MKLIKTPQPPELIIVDGAEQIQIMQKLLFVEIDNARLKEKLDELAARIKAADPDLHQVLNDEGLFDPGMTTQEFIES